MQTYPQTKPSFQITQESNLAVQRVTTTDQMGNTPMIPAVRSQHEMEQDQTTMERAPRRRRLLSPQPQPELTDVLFRFRSDALSPGFLRTGALSAFLDSRDPPRQNNRVKHYSFPFERFRDWVAKVAGEPAVEQWVLKVNEETFIFDEESSWQRALIGVEYILLRMDPETSPSNPVVDIEPFHQSESDDSMIIDDGTAPPQQEPPENGDSSDEPDTPREDQDQDMNHDVGEGSSSPDVSKEVDQTDSDLPSDHQDSLGMDLEGMFPEVEDLSVGELEQDTQENDHQKESVELIETDSALSRDSQTQLNQPQDSLSVPDAEPLVTFEIESEPSDNEAAGEYHHNNTALDQDDDEPLEDERVAPAQQILFKQPFVNEDQWLEICTVLDHPTDQREGGKLLLGTRQSLYIHQMAFIVRAMKAHRAKAELNGLLLADNVGLGKSICALGLFAVSSLALFNRQHTLEHPELHISPNEKEHGLTCPSNNLYGIQCVCVPGGITGEFANRLVGGPSVMAVPASNVDAWARRITDFFHREFMIPGDSKRHEMIEPLCYRETGQLNAIPVDGTQKPVRKEELCAMPKPKSLIIPKARVSKFQDVQPHGKAMSYQEAAKRLGSDVKIRFKVPDPAMNQSRFLILLSFTVLGRQTNALSRSFGLVINLRFPPEPGKRGHGPKDSQRFPVNMPFAVAINLVFFDESHSVTRMETQLYSTFAHFQLLSTVTPQRHPRWYFMTATPFSQSPSDIRSCLEFLITNRRDRFVLLSQLPLYTNRFRKLQRSNPSNPRGNDGDDSTAKFAADFAKFVRPFTVARDWGSPYLDTSLQDVRPGIKNHVTFVTIPNDLRETVERLGTRCRKALTDLRAKKKRELYLSDMKDVALFTQFFSAGIIPGIATILEGDDGHLLPTTVGQVDEDFKRGENSFMRQTLQYHEGHEWTQRLSTIIKYAHGGQSASASQRPQHILLAAQTPVLVGLIVRFLQNDPDLKEIVHAIRIYQGVTPKPAGRDTFLRKVAEDAAASNRSYVLVTTPRLIGVGIDITFCSYFIQFGEIYSNRDREQLLGRVNRPGQGLAVQYWSIKSTHATHASVRNRNNGRSAMLSEMGLVEEPEEVTIDDDDDG